MLQGNSLHNPKGNELRKGVDEMGDGLLSLLATGQDAGLNKRF
jgi:hypothetical protein